jgi:hypothetical protein
VRARVLHKFADILGKIAGLGRNPTIRSISRSSKGHSAAPSLRTCQRHAYYGIPKGRLFCDVVFSHFTLLSTSHFTVFPS